MSAIRAGAAFVELTLRRSQFTKGLRQAERSLADSAAKMQKIGGAIIGAGTALAAPFVVGIRAASDMEETMQKFNVVFGDASKEVKDWSDTFADSVGRSKQQIADFLASSQDLFIPLGFDPKRAEELSKTVTALAVDLASFNNKADADVQRDLQAALTGSGEVMKKYGVVLTETAVKQQLLNEGLNPKTATNAEKAFARLQIILAGTTNAQGDAIRSAGSFANQFKRLSANVSNAFVAIGNAVLPTVTEIVSRVNVIAGAVTMWIEKNQQLVRILAIGAVALLGFGSVVFGLGATLAVAGAAIGSIVTAMGLIANVVAAASGFITAFIGVLGTMASAIGAFVVSPLGIAVVAIGGAVAAFLTMTDAGRAVVQWFADNFFKIVGVVQDTVGGIFNALKAGNLALAAEIAFTGIKLAVSTVMTSILKVFGSSMEQMFQVLAKFGKTIVSVFAALEQQRQRAITGIATLIGKVVLDEEGQKALAQDRQRAEDAAKRRFDQIARFDAGKLGTSIADAVSPEALQKKLDELNKEAEKQGKGKIFGFDTSKLSIPGVGDFNASDFKIPGLSDLQQQQAQQGQLAFASGKTQRGTFFGGNVNQSLGGGGNPVMNLLKATNKNAKQQKQAANQQLNAIQQTNQILTMKKKRQQV